MSFDYLKSTTGGYKNLETAREYHKGIDTDRSWKGFRFWLITRYEKKAVMGEVVKYTESLPTVIDCPCGTGKLYQDLKEKFDNYIGLDISQEMIDVLKENYGTNGSKFLLFDLQNDEMKVEDSIMVCLRLMHRVPSNIRREMLSNISQISSVAVISYGIDNIWLRLKRLLRAFLFQVETLDLPLCSLKQAKSELKDHFEIVSTRHVLRGVSEQVVFSVKPKL